MSELTLKPRNDVHLARKVWHFFGVIMIAVCYHNMTRTVALQMLTVFGSLVIVIDYLRHSKPLLNNFLLKIFSPILRDSEKNQITGATYCVIGVFVIVFFFNRDIVMLSLLFLAFADPIASYFGIRYGKDRLFGRKSFQGTMAAFFSCLLVAGVYFYSHNIMTDRLLIVSILSGLAGAIAEAVPLRRLDDNLVMPVLSAVMLYGIFYLFGGFSIV
jgi:diacylglycerol kinase (CTP)